MLKSQEPGYTHLKPGGLHKMVFHSASLRDVPSIAVDIVLMLPQTMPQPRGQCYLALIYRGALRFRET